MNKHKGRDYVRGGGYSYLLRFYDEISPLLPVESPDA